MEALEKKDKTCGNCNRRQGPVCEAATRLCGMWKESAESIEARADEEIAELEAQVKTLRETLKYYAAGAPENCGCLGYADCSRGYALRCVARCGRRAREVLAATAPKEQEAPDAEEAQETQAPQEPPGRQAGQGPA